jgi:cell division initiation protein
MFNPSDIAEKRFEKAAFGYKPEAVEDFLAEISEAYSKLLWDKKELDKKIQVLAEKVQEYRDLEESLKETLLTAQRLGDSLIKESKAKAEATLSEATAKAEIILKDAQIKAEKVVENANKRLSAEQQSLVVMQREVSDFKTRLMSLYKTHIEIISALPEYEEDEPEVEEVETEVTPVEEENRVEFTLKEKETEQEVDSRFQDLKFGDDYDLESDSILTKSDN